MSFDRLAPHYRWLEAVLAGNLLQRARLTHLSALDQARHVLLVGEGPGRFLAALRARRPDVALTVVDASAAMLRAAKSAAVPDRTNFIQADLRNWQPPRAAFDAVVTSCVLDCFGPETLRRVIARLAHAATPTALWLHVDFAIPAAGWRRHRARIIHGLMYATFRWTTRIEARRVTSPAPLFRAAGFVRRQDRAFSAGLIRSELWQRDPNVAATTESFPWSEPRAGTCPATSVSGQPAR